MWDWPDSSLAWEFEDPLAINSFHEGNANSTYLLNSQHRGQGSMHTLTDDVLHDDYSLIPDMTSKTVVAQPVDGEGSRGNQSAQLGNSDCINHFFTMGEEISRPTEQSHQELKYYQPATPTRKPSTPTRRPSTPRFPASAVSVVVQQTMHSLKSPPVPYQLRIMKPSPGSGKIVKFPVLSRSVEPPTPIYAGSMSMPTASASKAIPISESLQLPPSIAHLRKSPHKNALNHPVGHIVKAEITEFQVDQKINPLSRSILFDSPGRYDNFDSQLASSCVSEGDFTLDKIDDKRSMSCPSNSTMLEYESPNFSMWHSDTVENKRRRVRVACVPCHFAKVMCEDERPCKRCRKMNHEDQCVNRIHRKLGRPRKERYDDHEDEAEYTSASE